MKTIDSLDELKRKLKINEGGEAQWYLINTCYRYMDKYVPKDKGLLRTIVDIDSSSITYMSEYAEYQYLGMREDGTHKITHYTTPNTGPYWDIKMMDAESNDVIDEVNRFIRR